MHRVDSIVSSITKMVKKLELAATIHYGDTLVHNRIARECQELSDRHKAEGDRAMAIKAKISDLVSV